MPASGFSEWLQTPIIAGLIGASIGAVPGFLALIYTRRIDKREQARDQPTVSFRLIAATTPGWFDLTVHLRNRSDAAWLLETIEFPHARDIRAASEQSLLSQDGYGGYQAAPPTDDNTRPGPVVMNVELSPSGAPGLFGHRGDERHEHVLFRCSSTRRRVSIRVALRSMESEARRIVLIAKRDIPTLTT